MLILFILFHLKFNFDVFIKQNGNLRKLMKTATYDYCRYVVKNGTTILDIIIQQFMKSSNIPETGCSLPAEKYFVNGLKLDGTNLTSLVPSGIYLSILNMMTLENNKKNLFLKVSFELRVC